MEEYFNEYLKAKRVLSLLVLQFYDYRISIKDAEKYGLIYSESDIKFDAVDCLCHLFNPEGERLWQILGYNKPIITREEFYKNYENVKNEKINPEINYYEEYLKMSLIIAHMVRTYYKYDISVENAKKCGVEYNEDDVFDGKIYAVHHLYESAGESAWNFLDLDEPVILSDVVYDKQEEIRNKLLDLTYNKNISKK